jgi:NAD(P)-dependent dehydrogenase (short-subunit alcohol dehydrogenase family)
MSNVEMPDGKVDLTGKVALVTGTTSGLGRRFAQVLAAAGAGVAITGRRIERLAELRDEIENGAGAALDIALDVTDAASIKDCVHDVESHFGGIDILVNNAGVNVMGKAVDLEVEDLDRVFDTNLRAVYLMAREVAKGMIAGDIAASGGGRIINIASIGAESVLPGLVAYCASKAGVVSMTRGMAREWARYEINVNALCPGYVETEINADWFKTEEGAKQVRSFPKRRLGDVRDLDEALLLLASPQARFITGSSLTVDDGQSLKI